MNPRLTRQQLLRRGAAGGALLAFPSLFAACGGGGGGGGGELKDVLNFANWPYYIDVDGKRHPTLDEFKAQTGITVNYFEEINDNGEYFAKVQGPLSQGQGIDRDIFVFTDSSRFPGLLVNEGWVQKLDKSLIPNFANLVDAQTSPPFDPNREYSLPWQSGMTGIAWNEDVTGPVETVDQLLTDPKLKGKVTMLKEMSDSVGVVMLQNGDDPTAVTDDTFNAAIEKINAAKESGQIRRFTGNEYVQPLSKGDLGAAISWSGDVVSEIEANPKLHWGLATTGGMIWTDNMLIPTGGSVPTASTYMNYVYDPVVAAKLAAAIYYVTPVKGAQEEIAKTDPKLAENQLIFPTEETLSQVSQFDSAALDNDEYITLWQGVLGQ